MSADWCDPRENCPVCGSGLLVERYGGAHPPVRFCSFITCDWSDHPEPVNRTCHPSGVSQ